MASLNSRLAAASSISAAATSESTPWALPEPFVAASSRDLASSTRACALATARSADSALFTAWFGAEIRVACLVAGAVEAVTSRSRRALRGRARAGAGRAGRSVGAARATCGTARPTGAAGQKLEPLEPPEAPEPLEPPDPFPLLLPLPPALLPPLPPALPFLANADAGLHLAAAGINSGPATPQEPQR